MKIVLQHRPRNNRTRDSEEKHDCFRTLWRDGPTEWEAALYITLACYNTLGDASFARTAQFTSLGLFPGLRGDIDSQQNITLWQEKCFAGQKCFPKGMVWFINI